MSSKALSNQIESISTELTKKILGSSSLDAQNNSAEECIALLKVLKDITTYKSRPTQNDNQTSSSSSSVAKGCRSKITIDILNETKIGICLNKLMKSFRRFNRSNDNDNNWKECLDISEDLLSTWKDAVKQEREYGTEAASSSSAVSTQKVTSTNDEDTECSSLPNTVATYRSRLLSHKKEMYKDPPVLPPPSIIIESEYCPLPKRNTSTGELSFTLSSKHMKIPASESKLKQYIEDFKPNRTPEEVLRAGSFGGTYFRPIISSVTNVKYNPATVLKETVEPEWIANLDKKSMLTSSTYNASINKYKVKCGGSLGMWESSGWIADSDPYGWFQWYCNFYRGRRCDDDERQMSRWLKSAGPTGRFRSQLCNKILAQGGVAKVNDVKISPVIRQTLLHWGLEITEDVLRKHGKRVGKL